MRNLAIKICGKTIEREKPSVMHLFFKGGITLHLARQEKDAILNLLQL